LQPDNTNFQLEGDRLAEVIAQSSKYVQTGVDSEGNPVLIRYCLLGNSLLSLQEPQQQQLKGEAMVQCAPNDPVFVSEFSLIMLFS
jgi:hypothetical protein